MPQPAKAKVQSARLKVRNSQQAALWPRKAGSIVPRLLDWFRRHARDLPWRRTLDPYAIWISEIMLQQTQVKTVAPYWERWMRELPSLALLAECAPEKVLKLWEGLGYYARARNLQKAAQAMIKEHGGQFPESYEAILALPGIGRYTAGAVCSIAFDQARPILDGNVIRVLTRVFGIAADPKAKTTNVRLWELAALLVERAKVHRPWLMGNSRSAATNNFSGISYGFARKRSCSPFSTESLRFSGPCSALNQSLMELGALVCTPTQPQCHKCPVRSSCVAFRQERINELPNLGARLKPTARRFFAYVVEHKGCWLVQQRPAGVINSHLWEFPNVEVGAHGVQPVEVFQEIFQMPPPSIIPLGVIRHSITRYRISLEAFAVTSNRRLSSRTEPSRWLNRSALDGLAFTSAHRKLLQRLQGVTIPLKREAHGPGRVFSPNPTA